MTSRFALWLSFAVLVVFSLVACAPDDGEPGSETETPEWSSGTPLGKADSAAAVPGFPDWEAVLARCTPPAADEPVVYLNDYKWGALHADMAAQFDEMYESDKRLQDRAYYDAERGELLLPHNESWGGAVVLPRRHVESVRRHIERALELGYVEFIFFPDMGHNHFFVPQERYDTIYAPYEVPELSKMYGEIINDPSLLVLYHTAEQLKMYEEKVLLTDRHLQWRYYTRNLVGDNDAAGNVFLLHDFSGMGNTARDYAGYHYIGGGMNLHASAGGCFPYVHNGEVRYFDLSFSDLPMPPSEGGGDYDFY